MLDRLALGLEYGPDGDDNDQDQEKEREEESARDSYWDRVLSGGLIQPATLLAAYPHF